LDKFFGEEPLPPIPDSTIVSAKKLDLVSVKDGKFYFIVDGDTSQEIAVDNIASLRHCRVLENFSLSGGFPRLTGNDLFALRSIKSMKTMDLGTLGNLSLNDIETFHRARPNAEIICNAPLVVTTKTGFRQLRWPPNKISPFRGCFSAVLV
jgi:hypothetical protein